MVGVEADVQEAFRRPLVLLAGLCLVNVLVMAGERSFEVRQEMDAHLSGIID